MPKFLVYLRSRETRSAIIEAPSREAAEKYYDRCDAGEVHNGDEDWELNTIHDGNYIDEPDVKVDAEGEVLNA